MRWGILFASGLLIAGAVTSTVGRTAEGATRGTPTPPATATATPGPSSVPPAPSDVRVEGNVLYWKDNSNNEDGFGLELGLCGRSFRYQVPANTTSFSIPPEVQPHINCLCGCRWFAVTAFNSSGRETGTALFPCTACAPSATATPAAVVMPATGTSGGNGAGVDIGWWLIGFGSVLLTGTMVLLYAERRARGRAT